MSKVPKALPREYSAAQNGMPEPVRYVYRQQDRRNSWAARIARRNAEIMTARYGQSAWPGQPASLSLARQPRLIS
jgi:hypothetical protein